MPARHLGVEDYFGALLDALSVDGVMMIRAYFDESGTHVGSPLTCVAGYLFKDRDARLLDRKWGEVLDSAGLHYFHMVDCAHGVGEFKAKSKPERISIETKLISLIKKHATLGIVASICDSDFYQVAERESSPYVLCLTWCLAGVAQWAAATKFDGKISYFFEAGHASQSLANSAMEGLNKSAVLKTGTRYHSHVFIGKEDARPLQAADLLAWQWHTDWKNTHGQKPRARRLDLLNLLGVPHLHSHLELANLRAMQLQAQGSKYLREFRVEGKPVIRWDQ